MSTVDLARRLGHLTGFVKNSTEFRDRVTGEVQGPKDNIDRFVKGLRAGPAGRVERVETGELGEVPGESGFTER